MMTRQKAEKILGVPPDAEFSDLDVAYNKLVQNLHAGGLADKELEREFETLKAAHQYLRQLKELGVKSLNSDFIHPSNTLDESILSEAELNRDSLDYAMREGHIVISFLVVLVALLNVIRPHYGETGLFGAVFFFIIIILFFGIPAFLRWRKTDKKQLNVNFLLAVKHSTLFHLTLSLFGALVLFFVLSDQLLSTRIFILLAVGIYLFCHFKLRSFLAGSIGKPVMLKLGLTFWAIIFLCHINKLRRFQPHEEVYPIVVSEGPNPTGPSYLVDCDYNDALFFRISVIRNSDYRSELHAHVSTGVFGWKYCESYYKMPLSR